MLYFDKQDGIIGKQIDAAMLIWCAWGAIVISVLIWLLLIVQVVPLGDWQIIVATLFGFIGFMLLKAGSQVQRTAARATKTSTSIQTLRDVLAINLDQTQWTLFEQMRLPDETVIPAVLVGERGVFALTVVHTSETHHNTGMRWLVRDEMKQMAWVNSRVNPSADARTFADKLTEFLAQSEIALRVRPRIAWTGTGLILQDEVTVPIWDMRHLPAMIDDLEMQPLLAYDLKQIEMLMLH